MQTVPSGLPNIKLVSTDGKSTVNCFVSQVWGNTYYFDTWLNEIDSSKQYKVEISTADKVNVPVHYTVTPNLGASRGIGEDKTYYYSVKDNAINKESGLLAISRKSSDSRDIEDGIANGDENCILAQKMYVRRIVDYIAKYYVEMQGCDAIVFTAGIGEKSVDTRRDVIEALKVLGVKLDVDANNVRGEERLISAPDSTIKCYVIPTDEELMIAKDTHELAK